MVKRGTSFSLIKNILLRDADIIQKLATRMHKKYLGEREFRSEFIQKYQHSHALIVQELAKHLDQTGPRRGTQKFEEFGEKLAQTSVQDGLTIEETVDGTIFLKQAIWKHLETTGALKKLTLEEYHWMNQTIGTYCDILSSKLAFTYHQERQYIEKNLKYLAEASKILSSSLDYETTLNTIARLAVPQVSDWCAIDLVENGKLEHVAVAHKDPKKVKWAKKLRQERPVDMKSNTGVARVIKTGQPEMYPVVTDKMLVAAAKNKKDLDLMRKIGFTSVIIVPLLTRKNPIGAITFVTTETNRHYNQADLIMAEELATRASVAIENARLYKGSQDAITVRDDFISVASHELKTPVTSVKMFAQVLKNHSEQIGDKKAVEHLTKMDKQLNKLTELIYDLLNISRIRAGRMQFRETRFDFDRAITEVIGALRQTEKRHKIIIEGETHKKVYGDEERIGQVLNNLVSNALKYSPKSDRILIKLSSSDSRVRVSVQDFGIGIGKEHLVKIFERFYRVYDNTDKTFPGLGIGLYISSEIVKRHGGQLTVKSDVGKGSIFSFSIPVNGAKAMKIVS